MYLHTQFNILLLQEAGVGVQVPQLTPFHLVAVAQEVIVLLFPVKALVAERALSPLLH
jgi:hypothetical protein